MPDSAKIYRDVSVSNGAWLNHHVARKQKLQTKCRKWRKILHAYTILKAKTFAIPSSVCLLERLSLKWQMLTAVTSCVTLQRHRKHIQIHGKMFSKSLKSKSYLYVETVASHSNSMGVDTCTDSHTVSFCAHVSMVSLALSANTWTIRVMIASF